MKDIFKKAFLSSIPVLTGYVVLGFGFGIILQSAGYGVFTAFIMSLCIYAGSMQYVAIGLLTSGASLITSALTTLMVNARHLFYGISMLKKYKDTGKFKPYLIFSLTDETYSLLCTENSDIPENMKKYYYFFVSSLNQLYWITGSVLGAAFGSVVKFNSEGIDFALTALFVTVFIEQWMSHKDHIPALLGVGATLASLLLFGGEISVVTAGIRFLPFIIFRGDKKTPALIEKLSTTLPYAVMGMLVVYCLKDMRFSSISGFLPMIIACLIVAILHLWKRNTLLSIISGTLSYMILIQFIF